MGEGVDPRWLEILKASGWQLFAVCVSLSFFWMLLRSEYLPPLDSPWVVYGLPLAILVSGSLSLVSLLEFIARKISRLISERKQASQKREDYLKRSQRFRNYLPHLTETELRILRYLFQQNQKTFVADVTGDLASTLYNQGFVNLVALPGQQISVMSSTFCVPDFVWEIMIENKKMFEKPKVELGYRNKRPWHSGF
ncbi:MAG: super-infection exclusion protein B [Tabrizicola sp.]|nr:super-infection exclusion protein B [Tabrizicola sp.]